MNPLLWVLLVAALMATPLEIYVALSAGRGATGQVQLHVWGIPLRWAFRTEQEGGRLRLMVRGGRIHTGEHQAPTIAPGRAKVWLGALLRTDQARKWLFGGVQLTHCEGSLRLALSNAARTAMVSGALAMLSQWLPDTLRLRVIPDFWGGSSAFSLRLGLFTRLGTLTVTAALLLAAWAGERREHLKHQEGI